ncbi:hypothetical protein RAD16_24995 [Bradyrhizobium sp. 18BD]
MAIVKVTTAALILKELKTIIELSSAGRLMPAAMRAGTIEGAANSMKQLLASSLPLPVVNPSRSTAKDFLRSNPSAEK